MTGRCVLRIGLGVCLVLEAFAAGGVAALWPWSVVLTAPWLIISGVGYAHAITFGVLSDDPS